MLSRWSIRSKLVLGFGLLLAIVVSLSWSGFDGLYAYHSLVRNLRRVNELPLAAELAHRVSDLRVAVLDHPPVFDAFDESETLSSPDAHFAHEEFRHKLAMVHDTLGQYCEQLQDADRDDSPLGDRRRERQAVDRIRTLLAQVDDTTADRLPQARDQVALLETDLQEVQSLVGYLPEYLQDSIHSFPYEVRDQYRRRIVLAWLTSGGTLVLLGLLVWLTYAWVFRPLRVLIKGSRKVADGRFDYRIRLETQDEMGELAAAMNQMTERFQSIHDDLDCQVQDRTRQVVRSEQLASVGFLAAGVAHEINAPLGRIAACAKSLQQRIELRSRDSEPQRRATFAQLRQVQDEAFRCKEITQSLLEFSRMGSAERQPADLSDLVQGMIDVLRHVGRYQGKHIQFEPSGPLTATVNAQQMRVVVLNLLCHGLDAVEAGGCVSVELAGRDDELELTVSDNGRGLTGAELAAVFEPCLRRGRQSTGLGLAISARIVKDHGGCITAASAGLGQGTQFRVCLPTAVQPQESQHGCQAV